MSYQQITDPALDAYERMAPFYDRFTAGYVHDHGYDRWLAQIVDHAVALGLRGHRALDVACGTGKSLAPLLDRGYEVTGCDLSPEMLTESLDKYGDRAADLFVADMRALPPVGTFDLVTCIDDAINYLLSPEELVDTFRGVAAILAPRGIYAFDVNSLHTYRTTFAQTFLREDAGGFFSFQGEATTPIAPGDVASATVEAFLETDDELWRRISTRHVQRHHPTDRVQDALATAGLECLAALGQRPGFRLEDHVDEAEHIKVVYFARLRGVRERGELTMDLIGG